MQIDKDVNLKENKKTTKIKKISDKRKLSTIRIKIVPNVDKDTEAPKSFLNIEQSVNDDNPLKLSINNQPITSEDKFESYITDIIDITINSPTISPREAKLTDTQSTKSDLKSLFEAYQTDTSNFSTAFKPTSDASSKSITPDSTSISDIDENKELIGKKGIKKLIS